MTTCPALAHLRLTRLLFLSVLALALLGNPAPTMAAGGLKMSPSRIDVAAERGDRLPPITFANGTNRSIVLTLDHAGVGQDVTGLPLPDPARDFLRIAPVKVRLAAGEQRVIRATVTGRATRGIGAYGVITATTMPSPRSGSAVIGNRLRLAGTVLLRFRGRAKVRGRVTAVRVVQGAPRVLRAFARVHNSGNIHTKPRVRLTVRNGAGKVVHAAEMPTGNVIPDAHRELATDIRRILPAGMYTARVVVDMGRERSSRLTRFTLVGPNQLPTSKLRILGLTTPRPAPGEAVEATVTVRNTGTAAIAPTGLVTLAPSGGGAVSAREPVTVGTVKPGMTTERHLGLPAVRAGAYELKVQFLDGDRVIAERTATFAPADTPPLITRVMDWIAGHLPPVIGALALSILLFVAVVLARLRRLKRRLLADALLHRAIREHVAAGQRLVPPVAGPAMSTSDGDAAPHAETPPPDAEPTSVATAPEWVVGVSGARPPEAPGGVRRRRNGGLVGKLRNLR